MRPEPDGLHRLEGEERTEAVEKVGVVAGLALPLLAEIPQPPVVVEEVMMPSSVIDVALCKSNKTAVNHHRKGRRRKERIRIGDGSRLVE